MPKPTTARRQMSEADSNLLDALRGLVARETSTVEPEWKNAALDDRAREEVAAALREVVAEVVREELLALATQRLGQKGAAV